MSSTELHEIEKKKRRGSGSSSSSESDKLVEDSDDPEVRFIQPNRGDDVKLEVGSPKIEFTGLSKDELMKYADDPFWKKVRWVLFILFWVLWIAMLVAAILIIVLTPKCPKIPQQSFWQKSCGYHVDVATFKDTNNDGIGDLVGISNNIDYLKAKGGFLVLSSIIDGSLGDKFARSTSVKNFKNVDSQIGTMKELKVLLKACRQKGLKTVIEFSPHTGKKHEWFQKALRDEKNYQNYYIWSKTNKSSNMVNRVGENVWNREKDGFYYWSSFHKSLPALNLNNSAVVDELSNAVTFWLTQGFDGIYIDNAAFLAPETENTNIGKGENLTGNNDSLAKWYTTGHNGQLHTDGSVRFIQEVRKAVDKVQKSTDRERLLLVSSGNTGLKQNREKTLAYLGNADTPGAHSVVVYDLVPDQGEKVVKSQIKLGLRDLVDAALTGNSSVMTVTQTLSGPRSDDFVRTCLNLLLPTTGLTLYGEEIGMTGYGEGLSDKKMYPKPAYWYITKAAMENKTVFIDDLVDSYDVPMQWTLEGGFSTANATYKMTFRDQNEMSLSTIGRGQTRLDVFNNLVKLSQTHSLNWGGFKWLEHEETSDFNYYMFSRFAKGFPTYIVMVMKPTTKIAGRARDLSKVCKEATPVLSFPSNEDFKETVAISMANVYFHFNEEGSIYVFKCK